jgi:CheY-like chemotaxis protein
MVFCRAEGPEVVIAHESEPICQQMGVVLLRAGVRPLRAANGDQARQLLEAFCPPAAILDVGLGGVLAFQLIEHIRRAPSLSATKVLLVASVFKKTAYKRRPASLYGADDYVEQHHIPDMLAPKVLRLIGEPMTRVDPRVDERRAVIAATQGRADLSGSVRMRALAHSIVADIALYYQAEFEKAVRGESADLDSALAEGRRLLEEIVDMSSHAGADPVGEAFAAFIEELRRVAR